MRKGKGFTPLEIKIPIRENRKFLTGFTLIELLMVISIVVLLMALLLPALQRVRKQAIAVVCQTNLKQWGTILNIYVEENRARLPSIFDSVLFFRGTFISDDDGNLFEIKGIIG